MNKSYFFKTCFLLMLFIFAMPVKSDERAQIEMPTEWDTYYVVLVKEGPNIAALQQSGELQAVMYEHIQYQLGLQKDGIALAAGGFAEAKEGAVGLSLLRVSSQQEAEQIAFADPAVRAGRFSVVVHQWYVPGGSLL